MPRAGYKTVCVTDKVYQRLQQEATQARHSIPEYILYLLEQEKNKKS